MSEKSSSKSEKPPIQCHECRGFCHMRIECPNYLRTKETKEPKSKVLAATLSDYESHLSGKYEGKGSKYIAYIAMTNEVTVESAGECEHDFEEEIPKKLTFREAYEELYTEYIKSENTSHLRLKALNDVKTEKVDLLVKLDETT